MQEKTQKTRSKHRPTQHLEAAATRNVTPEDYVIRARGTLHRTSLSKQSDTELHTNP